MRVLITGGAGFIGAWVGKALHEHGDDVVIVDDFSTTIYDGRLKEERVRALLPKAKVVRGDMADGNWFWRVTEEIRPEAILHFAAIAGIRYAQKDPFAVIRANVTGTASVFEAVKRVPVKRIVYASTSSVYGRNQKVPFHEDDPIQLPSSLYAATKRECELLAEVYRHTSEVQSIGLRFFTVYGPWGRPDHAIWLFTKAIFDGSPISLYDYGNAARDFTSIHDIVRGVLSVLDRSEVSCTLLNLGNSHPETNGNLVGMLERIIGKKARVLPMPLPKEDVPRTYADVDRAKELYGWEPQVPLEEGLREFVGWYRAYHRI